MINLKSMVGKRCVCQFRQGIICPIVSSNGDISVASVNQDGATQIISLPFTIGELKYTDEQGYVIKFIDEKTKSVIDIAIDPDSIVVAYAVSEFKRSSIITP